MLHPPIASSSSVSQKASSSLSLMLAESHRKAASLPLLPSSVPSGEKRQKYPRPKGPAAGTFHALWDSRHWIVPAVAYTSQLTGEVNQSGECRRDQPRRDEHRAASSLLPPPTGSSSSSSSTNKTKPFPALSPARATDEQKRRTYKEAHNPPLPNNTDPGRKCHYEPSGPV
ncbi:hypothetical protein TgHK011_008517 [Trichoderma gracile]|nr:hypothetical protein TgHK011_008517 [Trichoderma gracile]